MGDDLGTTGLRLERDGVLAWCVIDRPAARNAFTPAMYYGLKRAVALVNLDPQGEGWFVKLRIENQSDLDALLDEAAYKEYCEGLH